jgi:hypothetical protein
VRRRCNNCRHTPLPRSMESAVEAEGVYADTGRGGGISILQAL